MIQVKNLNKFFGTLKAVNKVNLTISQGEIFGLLGPNGAGKSTTINMLSSLIKSDSGSIYLNGIDLNSDTKSCKQILGVVPQEISLYDNFTAYDNLLFFGKLFKIDTKILKDRIQELLLLIGLEDRKNDLIKNYSGGMKRRINIAVALLHNPKIVLMDEPTVGVDPQSRNRIFKIIEALNKKGLTIIYTTHYMEEVERLCNRIAIMDKGKIIVQGTLKELQQQSNVVEKLEITFDKISEKQVEEFQKAINLKVNFSDKIIQIQCDVKNDLEKIISYCKNVNLIITDIKLLKANLEAIFLDITDKKLRD